MQAVENLDRVDIRSLRPLPASLTFGATVDVFGREQEITDFMVRRALQEVENLQQFPFSGSKALRAVKV